MRCLLTFVSAVLSAWPLVTAEPSPLDRLDARTIPAARQWAGQPQELVAVLGDPLPPHDDTHTRFVVAFRPDGKMLAFSTRDRAVRLIDLTENSPRARSLPLPGKRPGFAHGIAFSPNSKTLAVAGMGVAAWDLGDAEPKERALAAQRYDSITHCVAFTPDGKTVAAGCIDGAIRLYDVAGADLKEKAALRFDGKGVRALGIAVAPDGKTLAAAYYQDNGVRLWDLSAPEPRDRLVLRQKAGGRLNAVAFTPDGKKLLSGGHGEPFPLAWDLTQSTPAGIPLERHGGRVIHRLAVAPDGKTVAGSDHDGRVVLWDISSGKKLQEWQWAGAQGLAFAPDGRHLAVARYDSTVYILRLARAAAAQEP